MKVVWDFSGASNLPELNARLEGLQLRRTVADVGLQLPPKTRQMIYVDVPARERRVVANRKDLRAALDRAADAKIADAYAAILGHVQGGAKVVVFAWRRSVAEYLVNELHRAKQAAELVHGGVSTLRRGKAIERVRGASDGAALVATIDSASTGIDLSFASVGVFVELDYKPHALLQAEARLHRYGASLPVLIQYVIARGTTDELIASKVVAKLETFETVVGKTGESLRADLAGNEADMLAELYSAIEGSKPVEPAGGPRKRASRARK